VGNDSRVIPARLRGAKPRGGAVEIFLLKPASPQDVASLEVLLRACCCARSCERTPYMGVPVRGKGLRPGVQVRIEQDGGATPSQGLGRSPATAPGRSPATARAYAITATILAETAAGGRLVMFDLPWAVALDVGRCVAAYIHRPLDDPERYQRV